MFGDQFFGQTFFGGLGQTETMVMIVADAITVTPKMLAEIDIFPLSEE